MGKRNEAGRGQFIDLGNYDRTLGTEELNLAEWPLASLAVRPEPDQNTLFFEDEIFDKGKGQRVRRSLVVTGSKHFGLPTGIDSDVLLVLVHLTNVRNALKSKQVAFSRYELVKFMGWDLGGKSYKRLDESLQRWTSVTLHFKHAWWDRSGMRWQVRSFHVLESLTLRGRDEIGDDGLSSFVWSDVIFDSFQAGNLKRIDLNVYFRLESAAARRIFRFVDKRTYRPNVVQFDLRTFACEHIGFSRAYDAYDLKRKLQPAIEELEGIGFLAPLPVSERYSKLAPGRWQIVLERADRCKATREPERPAIIGELTRRGVNKAVAAILASTFSEQHISQKIELHDRLLQSRDKRISKNPPGFLAAAIRKDFLPPHDLSLQARRTAHTDGSECKVLRSRVKQVPEADFHDSVVLDFLRALPDENRALLTEKALADVSRLTFDTYQRLAAQRGRLWEEFREFLLAGYVSRNRSQFAALIEANKASAAKTAAALPTGRGAPDGQLSENR